MRAITMDIQMQECDKSDELNYFGSDVIITGKIVDERGKAAVEYLNGFSGEHLEIEYDSENFELTINNNTINSENLDDFLIKHKDKSIVIEGTTLGFVEIFLCCKALKAIGVKSFEILYVEPLQYQIPKHGVQESKILYKRYFDLSGEVPGYRAIPGSIMMLSDRRDQKVVFFLGYEERRIARALQDYQMIKPNRCSIVFGVPAFKPGWEMNSFANNIRVMRDNNIRGGVYFCGAENPLAAVNILNEIYEGLNVSNSEKLFIAPIGTKPNGIGVALFASTNQDVGILFDHPQRKNGRSIKVSKWHIYSVTL